MSDSGAAELNPTTDALSTSDDNGWIESASSIGGEVEVITNNLNKSVDIMRQPHYTVSIS